MVRQLRNQHTNWVTRPLLSQVTPNQEHISLYEPIGIRYPAVAVGRLIKQLARRAQGPIQGIEGTRAESDLLSVHKAIIIIIGIGVVTDAIFRQYPMTH